MPEEPGEDICAQGHQLKAEIENNKVGGRGHYHHAESRKQYQAVIFSEIDTFHCDIFHRY